VTATPTTKWQDWASFVLGLWLALSPWTFGYADHETATANAAVGGVLLALASHFGLSASLAAGEWLNAGLGAWLMAAPFALAFSTVTIAAANCVTVGAVVVLLAAWAWALDKEFLKGWPKRLAGH
jgi:hypothetical protein